MTGNSWPVTSATPTINCLASRLSEFRALRACLGAWIVTAVAIGGRLIGYEVPFVVFLNGLLNVAVFFYFAQDGVSIITLCSAMAICQYYVHPLLLANSRYYDLSGFGTIASYFESASIASFLSMLFWYLGYVFGRLMAGHRQARLEVGQRESFPIATLIGRSLTILLLGIILWLIDIASQGFNFLPVMRTTSVTAFSWYGKYLFAADPILLWPGVIAAVAYVKEKNDWRLKIYL